MHFNLVAVIKGKIFLFLQSLFYQIVKILSMCHYLKSTLHWFASNVIFRFSIFSFLLIDCVLKALSLGIKYSLMRQNQPNVDGGKWEMLALSKKLDQRLK